tara:strand:- start:101 stop:424 length:324 start_codon:yes stop_codon:yes gene_type:complete
MAGEQQQQPGAKLSDFAQAERDKLFPKNLYSPKSDKYGPQHPNALSDGDDKGRGTAVFLGIRDQDTGTKIDVLTRKDNVKTNAYNSGNVYTVPDETAIGGNTINLTS